MEVGGIEPPTRVVAQGLTGHCDQIVTLSYSLEVVNMALSSTHGSRTTVPRLLTFRLATRDNFGV